MDIRERLEDKKARVNAYLEYLFPEENGVLFDAMRSAVLSGGKRYRPLLLLSVGECFGVAGEPALPFACAIELIHNYSLIHDDLPCLDNDDVRRGKPTCHKAYGEDIALLAGDGLLTLAFEVMAGAPLDKDMEAVRTGIIRCVSRMAGPNGMVGGQIMDITLDPSGMTHDEYDSLIQKKTGGLIRAAVQAGGMLGRAGEEDSEILETFGHHLGMAFQIRDDILDSEEDSSEQGLPRPNSIRLFGAEEAEERLHGHIGQALSALERLNSDVRELGFLTRILVTVKEENNHG